jgi:hypothetical protein
MRFTFNIIVALVAITGALALPLEGTPTSYNMCDDTVS